MGTPKTTVSSPPTPLEVSSFTILPLTYPKTPSFPHETQHNLYIRAHEPKVPTLDSPRSLFLVNIPPDTTLTHIRALFSHSLGAAALVERLDLETTARKHTANSSASSRKRKRTDSTSTSASLPSTWDRPLHASGASAVAVFVDRAAAESALKAARRNAKARRRVVWGAGIPLGSLPPALGSQRYATHASMLYPDPTELQAKVDNFMLAFGQAEEARAKRLAKLRNVPDEDGFVTVTRGGRAGPAREEEAREYAAKVREKEARQAESLDGFYRFQNREKKKREAKDLVRRFDEGRRKVEGMRRARGALRPM